MASTLLLQAFHELLLVVVEVFLFCLLTFLSFLVLWTCGFTDSSTITICGLKLFLGLFNFSFPLFCSTLSNAGHMVPPYICLVQLYLNSFCIGEWIVNSTRVFTLKIMTIHPTNNIHRTNHYTNESMKAFIFFTSLLVWGNFGGWNIFQSPAGCFLLTSTFSENLPYIFSHSG